MSGSNEDDNLDDGEDGYGEDEEDNKMKAGMPQTPPRGVRRI